MNKYSGFSLDDDEPLVEPGSLPPVKGHVMVPKTLLDAAEADAYLWKGNAQHEANRVLVAESQRDAWKADAEALAEALREVASEFVAIDTGTFTDADCVCRSCRLLTPHHTSWCKVGTALAAHGARVKEEADATYESQRAARLAQSPGAALAMNDAAWPSEEEDTDA
jgi:hypothetical protein